MKDRWELSLNDLEGVSGGTSDEGSQGSGSFQSNTGTGLNIRVEWSVVRSGGGEKTLKVRISSLSYSLHSVELLNGIELHVNGSVYVGNSAAVNYSGSNMDAFTLATFSIPGVSGTVQLSAVWHFNGSYSGVSLQEIRADGVAVV